MDTWTDKTEFKFKEGGFEFEALRLGSTQEASICGTLGEIYFVSPGNYCAIIWDKNLYKDLTGESLKRGDEGRFPFTGDNLETMVKYVQASRFRQYQLKAMLAHYGRL